MKIKVTGTRYITLIQEIETTIDVDATMEASIREYFGYDSDEPLDRNDYWEYMEHRHEFDDADVVRSYPDGDRTEFVMEDVDMEGDE